MGYEMVLFQPNYSFFIHFLKHFYISNICLVILIGAEFVVPLSSGSILSWLWNPFDAILVVFNGFPSIWHLGSRKEVMPSAASRWQYFLPLGEKKNPTKFLVRAFRDSPREGIKEREQVGMGKIMSST